MARLVAPVQAPRDVDDRQAAHAGFDLLLGGHTHGGQICLPGQVPLTLDSVLPRFITEGLNVQFYFGGTSLLIVVGVVRDTFLNIEAELKLHGYQDSLLVR